MLNPDNEKAREAFSLSNERWEDYTPYDRALVDLEYKVDQSDGGQTKHETGPSKEAVISLDPEIVVERGYASHLLSNQGSTLDMAERYGQDILKRLVEADDVYIEFSKVSQSEIEAIVSPSGYTD